MMKIKRFIGGALESNGYILYQKDGGNCYIVDPGYQPKVFLSFIQEKQLTVKGILLTHHHYDHVGGCEKIVNATDCPVFIHREDLDRYKGHGTPIEDGDSFDLDGETILVVHTPGHTRGGVCYYSEKSKLAFTGDTIFNVDLGRTDLEDGNQRALEASIGEKIALWSNEIVIYPGHGDSCTMSYVKKHNEEVKEILGRK